ncbi:Na(+)/H(+) exchange regulatory cofactor NHE-RF1 [Orussus abietinus]|uniref:Na(+)/H(+) exchange regulatory cofactor NHE-RF1 n=1 Tax=Orussus abietinus TaxID=222816 RepID=UPI0006262110|nr:Na(+)/H(+) exchange regulatory cofactor NHE-RF1 [Orussus abietinus]
MSSLKGDRVPSARLCHIVKWDDFDGYGFNLHAEKGKNGQFSGQFIGKVDEGSPSQAAGLKQGDRIVEVNEINIANETHKQVVERIKAFPTETKLLVVDQEADEYFKANNIVIRGSMANVKVIKTPERDPATVEMEAREEASIGSADENAQKSIGSNDGSSGSIEGSTTLSNEESSLTEKPRQNGNDDSHEHATGNGTGNSTSNIGSNTTSNSTEHRGLNLKMTAKELRAQLAARKKYDPKKESIGFKDKFDIVQKL